MRLRKKVPTAVPAFLILLAATPAKTVTYEELCKYDAKFCDKVRDGSGNPVKPLPEIVAVLKKLNPQIQASAKAYDVDPRAIIGAILAENSLNVTKSRSSVKDFLYATGLSSAYQAATGHQPSLGLGQIQPGVAIGVEDLVAKTEGRLPRTQEEIKDALRDPIESIKYVAGIVRSGRDTYKKYGIDISHDPGVLDTVYNLGKAETRAGVAKAANAAPRVNFFGFFVNENLKTIDEINTYVPPKEIPEGQGSKTTTFANGQLPVSSYPPDCNPDQSAASSDYTRNKTYDKSASTGYIAGFYTKVGSAVDCDLSPWSLVKGSNNVTGWVKDDKLAEKTRYLPGANMACQSGAAAACKKSLADILGASKSLGTDKNGNVMFALNRVNKDESVDVKQWSTTCLQKWAWGQGGHKGSGGSSVFRKPTAAPYAQPVVPPNYVKIDQKEAEDLQSQLKAKQEEFRKQVGDDIANDPDLKFRNTFFLRLDECRQTDGCYVDKGKLTDFLKTDLSSKLVNYATYESYARSLKSLTYYQDRGSLNQQPSDHLPAFKDGLEELENQCDDVYRSYPTIYDQWIKFKSAHVADLTDPDAVFPPNLITQLSESCSTVRKLQKPNATNPPCKNPNYRNYVGYGYSSELSPLTRKLYSSRNEQEKLLLKSLDQLSAAPQQQEGEETLNCNYDPAGLAKDVDKLRGLSCVDSILVPDMAVVKKFTANNETKVLFSNFEQPDRFAVRISGACSDEK